MAPARVKLPFGICIACLAVQPVLAQDQGVDVEFFDLGEIVLYGDRTTDALEDSNASVGIVDAEALDSPNYQTLTDTYRRLGNVTGPNSGADGFKIRGVNSEGLVPGAGGGGPVASLYIDGIQQTVEGTRQGARGLFDTEQVEVFRGPQSTLTGRNALAGAIYVRTKDPEFENSGRVQLTYGEDNRQQVGLAYGGALSDTVAFRISGEWFNKDSDLNFPTYEGFPRLSDLDTDQYYQVRGKLLWLPTGSDDTRVLFTVSRAFDGPSQNLIASDIPGSDGTFDERRSDVSSTNPEFQEVRETDVDNVGLEVTHDLSEALRFTSFTGWTNSDTDRGSINLGTPGATFFTSGFFDVELFTQEFRLNFDDGRTRWVAGVYAATEESHSVRQSVFPIGTFVIDSANDINGEQNNLALFGEVAYEFAPKWSVIAGGRVDYFESESKGTTTFNGAVTLVDRSFSATEFLPKLGVAYDISDTQRLSLIYQQGYRPGGSSVRPDTSEVVEFDAETTDNIELGYRGTLMDGRMIVSANLFYQEWQGQQLERAIVPGNPLTNVIENAGESESYGGELEISYVPNNSIRLFSSLGLLHTEFTDFVLDEGTPGEIDFTGFDFPNAPQTTLSVGIDWQNPQGWFAGGVVQYVGSQLSRLEGTDTQRLDSYITVDAQAGYMWDNGARLTLYANNLFDEEYFTFLTTDETLAALGPRREIGVRFDRVF